MQVEQDTRTFLKRIVNTLSAVIVWMVLHVMVGLYLGWALFENTPTIGNIIYYIVLIVTLVALVFVLKRIWKKS